MAEFLGEVRSEAGISVGNDFTGSAVVWENMLDIEVSNIGCGSHFMAGNEDGGFGAVIVMTVHLGLLFFFTLPLFPLRVMAAPLAACNSLELDYPLIPRLGQDALQTVHLPLPLSITCFTFTATVPFMRASVPADA